MATIVHTYIPDLETNAAPLFLEEEGRLLTVIVKDIARDDALDEEDLKRGGAKWLKKF